MKRETLSNPESWRLTENTETFATKLLYLLAVTLSCAVFRCSPSLIRKLILLYSRFLFKLKKRGAQAPQPPAYCEWRGPAPCPGEVKPDPGEAKPAPVRARPDAAEVKLDPGRARPDPSEVKPGPDCPSPDPSRTRPDAGEVKPAPVWASPYPG